MVYNRSKQPAEIWEYPDGYDEYGTRLPPVQSDTCDIHITLYSQTLTEDARYKDVTHIGYTDTLLTDRQYIKQGDRTYKVLYAGQYGRRVVAHMREVTDVGEIGITDRGA